MFFLVSDFQLFSYSMTRLACRKHTICKPQNENGAQACSSTKRISFLSADTCLKRVYISPEYPAVCTSWRCVVSQTNPNPNGREDCGAYITPDGAEHGGLHYWCSKCGDKKGCSKCGEKKELSRRAMGSIRLTPTDLRLEECRNEELQGYLKRYK